MADITGGMKFNIEQSGGKELKTTLDGISKSLDEVGVHAEKQSSSLSKFIARERTQNRERSFLFKESRNSILLASSALMAFGDASDGAGKKLGTSMTKGFIAMEGAGFAMSALGVATGGTSTAITALIGTGVGLYSFLSKSAEEIKKTADELKEYRNILEQVSSMHFSVGTFGVEYGSDAWNKLVAERKGFLQLTIETLKKEEVGLLRNMSLFKRNEEEKLVAMKEYLKVLGQRLAAEDSYNKFLEGIKKKEPEIQGVGSFGFQKSPYMFGAGWQPETGYTGRRINELPMFFEGGKQPGDIWKKQQELEATEGLLINASGEDRLKLLGRRKQLQQEINVLNMTDTELQQEALMILGNSLSQIQSAMDQFGISQTSLIGQMVSGFQRILEIVETIKAVTAAINAIGMLGIFHSGGVPVPMAHTGMMLGSNYQGHREAIVKMHSGEEIITPYDPRHRRNGGRSIGTNVNVNYNVRAIDARSFETTINTSQHRRSLVKAIDKALRSNN